MTMTMTKALRLALLSLPLAASAVANDGGAWQPPVASLNLARQEVGAARIGEFVYVAGGLVAGPPIGATRTVERYDIANDRWEFVAPMPLARDHLGVAAAGGRLYAVAGFGGDFVPTADAHVYDPAADAWSPIAPLPEPRGGCFAAEHGGRIFVFGGEGPAGNSRATFVYDPAANEWTRGADMAVARNHLVAVTAGDFIHVLGGRPPVTAANERYDPVRDEWRAMAPMPTARAAMAAAAIGGVIVVAGGETPRLHAVTEIYDVATDAWACADEMPVPRHGIAAVSLGDRMLVPAGGVIQGFAPTAYADTFVPPPPPRAPILFAMKAGGVETARLLLERFDGRFFATVERGGAARCENVPVAPDVPGAGSFPCGPTVVRIRKDGATLVWEAGTRSGTLCRL